MPKILRGSDTAATISDGNITTTLTEAFKPSVDEAVRAVGVIGKYDELMKSMRLAIREAAFLRTLGNYVVSKAD